MPTLATHLSKFFIHHGRDLSSRLVFASSWRGLDAVATGGVRNVPPPIYVQFSEIRNVFAGFRLREANLLYEN